MKRIVSVLMVCVLLICMVPLYAFADEVQTTPMYRLYNPNSGEHFYTGSVEEKENLVSVGWNYEGIAWNAPIQDGDPVYRLYNPNSGDHHYTMSWLEVQMLEGYGWSYEGVAWNSVAASDPAAVPLYRLYNPNAECGIHHYTNSVEERDNLIAIGWIYEGIGWFGAGDHEHSYIDTEVKGSCTTDGYKNHTCITCGDTYQTDVVLAAGHKWEAATCTKAKTCSVCNATEGTALGHAYEDGVCTVCGAAKTFSAVSGIWTLEGITDDGEELEKVSLTFINGNAYMIAIYYGKVPQEHLESALEKGYADTDEGRIYYNGLTEYNGEYYYWLGGGTGTDGSFTESGNTVTVSFDSDESAVMVLKRTAENKCEIESITGTVCDELITHALINGKTFTYVGLAGEE